MSWIKKIFRVKPKYPATSYWQEYAHLFDQPVPQKSLFRAKRMVVLDTETTGLDPTTDKLLSIGAIAVRDQQIFIGDRFEAFFSAGDLYKKQERESVPVHGILQKHSAHLPDNQQVLINLLAYLQDSIIVGHHIAFDFTMLNNAFLLQLGGPLQNQVLDTAHLAKRLSSPLQGQLSPLQAGQYSLDKLCKTYHIPVEGRHTANGDAFLTSLLLLKLLGRLEKRGVKTLKDLLRQFKSLLVLQLNNLFCTMKLFQLSLLFIFALMVAAPVSEAAVLHPKPAEKTEVADQQMGKKEQRQLRREQRRSFRKAVRAQFRDLRKNSSSSDVELILLVIIALFIPPLAMFLFDGTASSRFWISLVLMLLAIPLWGTLGALALTASVVYTLYIILSESL